MRVPVVAPKQITGIRGEHSPALSLSPALRHCTGAAASKQMCCCPRQLSLPLHPLCSSLYRSTLSAALSIPYLLGSSLYHATLRLVCAAVQLHEGHEGLNPLSASLFGVGWRSTVPDTTAVEGIMPTVGAVTHWMAHTHPVFCTCGLYRQWSSGLCDSIHCAQSH